MTAVDRNPWLVVLGSAMALTVGNGPIMQFTFGVFPKPVVEEFNVARGMGSLALTIGLITTAGLVCCVGACHQSGQRGAIQSIDHHVHRRLCTGGVGSCAAQRAA